VKKGQERSREQVIAGEEQLDKRRNERSRDDVAFDALPVGLPIASEEITVRLQGNVG
jgi:hypothetical protein